MIALDTLTIFFSWKCTFSCGHCGFDCSPLRREKMDLERALHYIEEASENPDLKMVAYSGGEPFLFFDHVLEAMKYAHDKGLAGGLVTNCYWANSAEMADRRLDRLAGLGLREIIVSLDDFHLKYVPIDHIRHVVHAALRLGVRVGVNMLVTRQSRVRRSHACELLHVPSEMVERSDSMWLRESSPLLFGRADCNLAPEDLYYYGEEDLKNASCYYVVRNMIVTPNSSLYACCGFGDSSRYGPASIAYIGDLGQTRFADLFDQASRNLLLNIIATYGPWLLLKLAEEFDPSIPFPREYVSTCSICGEISSNPRLRAAVAHVLQDLAQGASTVSVGSGAGG